MRLTPPPGKRTLQTMNINKTQPISYCIFSTNLSSYHNCLNDIWWCGSCEKLCERTSFQPWVKSAQETGLDQGLSDWECDYCFFGWSIFVWMYFEYSYPLMYLNIFLMSSEVAFGLNLMSRNLATWDSSSNDYHYLVSPGRREPSIIYYNLQGCS